ncbi:MAG: SPOR domain-containing protein [Saprospiraceae bacterium]|nr:SPOR domain-containing protein [Saprospiraceae bacterium]MCF8250813.1 SPOR domain-containing protein [Saprospiraceae bacterium]MCF8282697.1 SPOR domain-containing protein [Bacteroidales bacterium]MCF8312614.1 SPOR domain-containing protein [Saprospiraceae bacterium]MCF8441004.1 SPOR domain-containing protein [Saprospiraceae bacterium]
MSKLDYVTIAIVGICILAILFLVYKMTNVFNSENPKDKTEIAVDPVETEDDGVYDYEIDKNVDSTGINGNASSDKTSTTKPSTSSTTSDIEETSASSAPAEDDATETTGSNPTTNTGSSASDNSEKASYSNGKFMVLAGSFTKKALAESQVKKLNKLGYVNARVELFDRGKYAVVLVDRFSNMAEAERTVKKLNGDGVKSYVKTKS